MFVRELPHFGNSRKSQVGSISYVSSVGSVASLSTRRLLFHVLNKLRSKYCGSGEGSEKATRDKLGDEALKFIGIMLSILDNF